MYDLSHQSDFVCQLVFLSFIIVTLGWVSLFNGIETFLGYSMPNLSLKKNSNDII